MLRRLVPVFLSLLGSWMLWSLWLGWDTSYDIDASTGRSTGPYEVVQILGLAACVAVLTACFRGRLQWWLLAVSVSAGLTAGAAVSFSIDDSGLAAVGLVLIFLGSMAGTSIVCLAAHVACRPRAAVRAPSAHVES